MASEAHPFTALEHLRMIADAGERFEVAWNDAPFPALSAFVPPPQDPLRERVLVKLIRLDQERRYRAGQAKRLEEYLADWPELVDKTSSLRELLAAECLTRAILDVAPTRDELRGRFPKLADDIDLEAIAAEAHSEAPNPLLNLAGTQLSQYAIHEFLGAGGMGVVYRAHDAKLNREVALKICTLHPLPDPPALGRFFHEARVISGIDHPNLCTIYDADHIDGIPFISMALIPGESLAKRLERGPFAPHAAVALVIKLARVLAKIHERSVVHRDLKPSNIMLKEGNEPVLMDFGLAQLAGEVRPQITGRSFSGTPAYLPPEHLDGSSAAVDPRADIYSLGAVLYQLLTGKLPFTGERTEEVLEKIRRNDLPAPGTLRRDIHPLLETVCLRAMAKQPEDRFPSALEFAIALEMYLLADKHRLPNGKPRWLIAGLVGTLVLGIGVGAWTAGLVVSPGSGGTPPMVDPNASSTKPMGNAEPLALGPNGKGWSVGRIKKAREEHWFQVRAAKDGFLVLDAIALENQFDATLTLFDVHGRHAGEDNNAGAGPDARIVRQVRADDTYLVLLKGHQNPIGQWSKGAYVLVLSQPDAPPAPDPTRLPRPIPIDSYPDTRETAHALAFGPEGRTTLLASIQPEGDQDWFTFTCDQPGTLIITFDTPESSLDALLSLHNGTEKLAEDRIRIVHPVSRSERFWLHVRGLSPPHLDLDSYGRYLLHLIFLPADDFGQLLLPPAK